MNSKITLFNIGHRGAAGHLPENTLASIKKAVDLNVDMIEFDVYCIDGELVLIHKIRDTHEISYQSIRLVLQNDA